MTGKYRALARTTSLKKLAEHLGLHPATVSVVLNEVPGRSISQPTRDRIKAAAKEFNYQPSLLAHSPVVQDAAKETCRHALAAGKRFGTLVPDLEYAKNMLDIGATLLCDGGDLHFVRQALLDVKTRFAPLGFEFEPALRTGRKGPDVA